MRTKSLAKLSISANLIHILGSLIFRRQFFPSTTAAFPNFVQILFWIEFGLAGIVVSRILDRTICSEATQSNIELMSVTSVGPIAPKELPSISASDRRWALATALSFVCLIAILFSIHPPKFVQ